MSAQAVGVVQPGLVLPRSQFGEREVVSNVLEVAGEGGPPEAPHILDDESPRRSFPHGANGFREHVALVQRAVVLAS